MAALVISLELIKLPSSIILKHIRTVLRIDQAVRQLLEEDRRIINASGSGLNSLSTLFLTLFKAHKPTLILHQSDTRFQESYIARVGDFEAKLVVLSYNERDIVPSVIKSAQTVLQLNSLRNHLVGFANYARYESLKCLFEFPTRAFAICGARIPFECEHEEGQWTVWFCDQIHRTSACMQITHCSLMEDTQQIVRR